ncbi:hypothetical protein AXE80_02955 [Wenyingzhuangia fucanilytica]|uniref:Uncharacterized protein n=2 Tax=Wenyingzhuangia fucanilytica TaxID=1790137 RepID=A0A1B1Y3J1_9FLAO|nr:hypothetical protein AXE80_02955 [Wenyingzhuangia fucanilytica]
MITKMKNLRYLIIVFTLIFVYSYDDESDALPPSFQDATWVTNVRPSDDYVIVKGEDISFRDLSQGALTHQFIIEEGNHFLYSGYKNNDSLPLFINKNLGTVSIDKDAHVLFLNQGINKVTLRNTFKDSISYKGAVVIPAFKENDVWVIEKTWEIDVFGDLLPAFKVLDKNGDEIINVTATDEVSRKDEDTWPVINVEAGDALTYIDLTTEDRPTGRNWSLTRAKTSTTTDSIVSAGYFSLGTFTAGTFTSSRGGDFPVGRGSKIIPLKINVVPSSQPFVYNADGGMLESPDEVITFGVTGELVPFTGEESSFTVNVKNADNGFDKDIAVTSAKINADDATKIDLKLAEPIYNSDVVTVSYAGSGIKSVDTRDLLAFGPIEVSMDEGFNLFVPALESYASIEDGSSNVWGAYCNGCWVGKPTNSHDGDGNATENFYFTRGMATADNYQVSDGDASMRYISPSTGITGGRTIQFTKFKNLDLPAGRYKMRMDVFMVAGNTMSGINMWFKGPNVNAFWDLSPGTVARDEFVTVENVIDFSVSPTSDRFDIQVRDIDNPNGLSSTQEFYFDNLVILPIELRP